MKKIITIIIILIVAIALFVIIRPQQTEEITSFEECVEAGYPVMESYPQQCKTPDGKTFTENIGNELEKDHLIRITSPRPNEIIQSPLTIKGQAKGTWFFEADFPIKLKDANNNTIATAIAQTTEDWMTEEFISFQAELEFQKPETKEGTLILEKANPSGLPENEDQLIIPIKFK
ncbi:MAG: hypothetical protein GF387_00670 [Candidatus Portnoybacteria bacterium]|nr:hypothetical protein [Candidatus Portnoybacteria bacterium]